MHEREESINIGHGNGDGITNNASCCDNMFVDYTNEDITESRWAPRWLLATTRFLSFLLLALVTAFQHHPSYSASLFVTYGLSLSFFLLAIAPLLESKKEKNVSSELPIGIGIGERRQQPRLPEELDESRLHCTGNVYLYPSLTGFLYSFFAVLNSYLLVDFLRMWVHWGTWNFSFWWDLYLPADLISVVLIFVLYATDILVMQAKVRLSYRYGMAAWGTNTVAFTAVYAANVTNNTRAEFRNNPGSTIAIWIAHHVAYLILTLGIVGISRIRWCCYEQNTKTQGDGDDNNRDIDGVSDVENQT